MACKLPVSRNRYSYSYRRALAVVECGHGIGSCGSVIISFRCRAQPSNPRAIAPKGATRFWITVPQSVNCVIGNFNSMAGAQRYVPQIPSARVVDLAGAISPGSERKRIGITPVEKRRLKMLPTEHAHRTTRQEDRYLVMPSLAE